MQHIVWIEGCFIDDFISIDDGQTTGIDNTVPNSSQFQFPTDELVVIDQRALTEKQCIIFVAAINNARRNHTIPVKLFGLE